MANQSDRIRNKAKNKPIDLVDQRNQQLRSVLQKGEYQLTVSGDLVVEDEEGAADGTGSASDEEQGVAKVRVRK